MLFSISLQEREEKSYGNSKDMGRNLKHTLFLDKANENILVRNDTILVREK